MIPAFDDRAVTTTATTSENQHLKFLMMGLCERVLQASSQLMKHTAP